MDIGEWKKGKKERKGIFYWKDGDKYEGEQKIGIKEGKGIFYWNDGDKYDGEYKTIKKKEKEYIIIIMEINMMVNGKMIK